MVGDILQRAGDLERIRSFLMNSSLSMLFSSLTFLVFCVILLFYSTVIFWVFIAGSTCYFCWVMLFMRVRKKLDWEYFGVTSKNQSFLVETITAAQDIKLNNYEKKKRWAWESIQAKLYRINLRVLSVNSFQTVGGQAFNNITTLLITFICAKEVISGHMTFGAMISTQFIIGMLSGPVSQFISFIQSYQYARISFLRLNEIHQLQDEEEMDVAGNIALPGSKTIIVKNVSFQYTPGVAKQPY
jgi:ATP-binding cassette subfamily B protein